jgi:starch synthase
MKRVWLVAAENDALPGGKVGGVGDVVRDLPIALAAAELEVSVITPSYDSFHHLPGAVLLQSVEVEFAGGIHVAEVYRLPATDNPVEQLLIEHPLLSPHGPGQIYVNDEPGNPFAIDAAKFAFFNAAVAAWVNACDKPPHVIHLNDWHTGLVPALRDFGDQDTPLAGVRLVFTIHNLAYQGVRPFRGHKSSLESWFPHLLEHQEVLQDPRYDNCINFMVSAIRLADGINTVSPSYALEIQQPSDPTTGFCGGEGLEGELARAGSEGRLSGILNGCMYPEKPARALDWDELLEMIARRPDIINASQTAAEWIKGRRGKPPASLLLSIGRVVDQKVPLFLEPVSTHATALEAILDLAGPESLFIMLGSGDIELEQRFAEISTKRDNFLYLRGYVDALSEPLYAYADLFLMPSSFEPCGISQMLAMRAGQPCVVHAVGGLKDTVSDGASGFVFAGRTPAEQAENFVASVGSALAIKNKTPSKWQKICATAAGQHFSWAVAANTYKQMLYRIEQ